MSCRRTAKVNSLGVRCTGGRAHARRLAAILASLPLLPALCIVERSAARAGDQAAVAATASDAGAGIAVVSVLGDVTFSGVRASAGQSIGRTTRVKVGEHGAAQLLVRNRLAVGLWGSGHARLTVDGQTPGIVLHGGIRARLSGVGHATTVTGWTLELQPGSSVIVEDARAFVLRGGAAISAPPEARCAPTSQPDDGSAEGSSAQSAPASRPLLARGAVTSVRAGEVVALGTDGCASADAGTPDVDSVARSSAHAPPPPWRPPAMAAAFLAETGRAVQGMRAQQRTEQETASCGCTEGGGPNAGPVGQGAAGQPLERRNATVRVRVTGVPRRGAP